MGLYEVEVGFIVTYVQGFLKCSTKWPPCGIATERHTYLSGPNRGCLYQRSVEFSPHPENSWSLFGLHIESFSSAVMLAGYNDPRRTHHSGGELDIRFTNMLKTYKDANPVPKPQVALPVAAIECAAAAHQRADASPMARATAQLIIIAFFFLLRVGEYTKAPESTATCTVHS